MTNIESIMIGDLRPFKSDSKGDDFYSPAFRQLASVEPKFQPCYKINFPAPLLSPKTKYYKRLIDNDITIKLNELFELLDGNGADLILFHRKKLFELIKSHLESIQKYIDFNQHDLSEITSRYADFSKNLQHSECTYIFNYMLTALIRCYLEFQTRYKHFIDEDRQFLISDFYTQILKRQTPENTFIEEVITIPVVPVSVENHYHEDTKAESDFAVQLAQDNYTHFMAEVNLYHFTELPKVNVLSAENQNRLIANIVGNGTPYAIAMLDFLEYPDWLHKKYSMNKEGIYGHIAKAISAPHRTVKGNLLALNPDSNSDWSKYTACQHEQKVKEDYKKLLI